MGDFKAAEKRVDALVNRLGNGTCRLVRSAAGFVEATLLFVDEAQAEKAERLYNDDPGLLDEERAEARMVGNRYELRIPMGFESGTAPTRVGTEAEVAEALALDDRKALRRLLTMLKGDFAVRYVLRALLAKGNRHTLYSALQLLEAEEGPEELAERFIEVCNEEGEDPERFLSLTLQGEG